MRRFTALYAGGVGLAGAALAATGVIAVPAASARTAVPCSAAGSAQANFRWHYRANGTSGSWSGTRSGGCPTPLTAGPQAMEGDLKVSPGTQLQVGYDFTFPGNHATFTFTVHSPQVVFTARCVSGAVPSASTFTVPMPTQTYTVTDDQWYPSGDQHSALVYQGSKAVPDLCGGGQVRLDQGGTFTASTCPATAPAPASSAPATAPARSAPATAPAPAPSATTMTAEPGSSPKPGGSLSTPAEVAPSAPAAPAIVRTPTFTG